MSRIIPFLLIVFSFVFFGAIAEASRTVVSLNGVWQIEEGSLDVVPEAFSRTIPVPGLVDQAEPGFEEVRQKAVKDPRRDAYWYRREFSLDNISPLMRLKIHKAAYGSKVFLNGREIGEVPGGSNPAYYDLTKHLKKGNNELIVRVGADRKSITGKAVIPYDPEKAFYIPGIFDMVELIGTDACYIENIQTCPDIDAGKVRVQVRLINTSASSVTVSPEFVVKEWKSGVVAGTSSASSISIDAAGEATADAEVAIKDCRLWSPESPFLYVLETKAGKDVLSTRFGMRTFRFDPKTRVAKLNGKPYYLRGSNFTVYRFFEDPLRNGLPWNENWARLLHERVKDMHWNSLRYCIGFPPEFWYDIADELGILIQDEFPIWKIEPGNLEHLIREYTAWMRERWNHPCVVIWDACNETVSTETMEAAARVRGLDLSNRPWDNGYNPPAEPGDVFESHPYHFNKPRGNPTFRIRDLADLDPVPQGNVTRNDQTHAVIINEYGWLWLDREGYATPLTEKVYLNLAGFDSTVEQRRHIYATHLAADTEWFRLHRKVAGLLHFTTLGYSRPGGATSDHWGDITKLEWEPHFYEFVRDSFAPICPILNYWNDRISDQQAGNETIEVVLLNDLEISWTGPVTCRIRRGEEIVLETSKTETIGPYEAKRMSFEIAWPKERGQYRLETELIDADGKPVRSIREFEVLDLSTLKYPIRGAFASSTYQNYPLENAFDSDPKTYWSSEFRDSEWIMFDLGASKKFHRISILWEKAYSEKFDVKVSGNAEKWTGVFRQENGEGGLEEIEFEPISARYIRINFQKRGPSQKWGNAIREFNVFEF